MNKFQTYLIAKHLDIYDVAKMIRDSSWNESKNISRQRLVPLLHSIERNGWDTIVVKGNRRIPGVVDAHHQFAISAYTVAKIIGCTERDIL